jgi:hypothetical protein
MSEGSVPGAFIPARHRVAFIAGQAQACPAIRYSSRGGMLDFLQISVVLLEIL